MSSVSLEKMTEAGVPDVIRHMTADIYGEVGTYPKFFPQSNIAFLNRFVNNLFSLEIRFGL